MTKRKLMKTGLAIAAAMVVMTGCGNNAATATTAATTAAAVETEAVLSGTESRLTDEASLKLGEYKGLTHTKVKAEVTSGEVEAKIHALAVQYALYWVCSLPLQSRICKSLPIRSALL